MPDLSASVYVPIASALVAAILGLAGAVRALWTDSKRQRDVHTETDHRLATEAVRAFEQSKASLDAIRVFLEVVYKSGGSIEKRP